MRVVRLVSPNRDASRRVASVRAFVRLGLATVFAGGCSSPGPSGPPAGNNVLAVVSGDGQHARITRELPLPIVIEVRSASGTAVSGAAVTFTPSTGSVNAATATSDTNGQASVRWTLGLATGAHALTVRFASGAGPTLTVNATADPATVVQIQVLDGDRQQAVVGTAVGTAPSVMVRDAQGNPMPGIALRFAVMAGAGVVGSTTATSDAAGIATPGSWTMGAVPGSNVVSVTPVASDVVAASPTSFSAMAVAPGGVVSSPVRSMTLNTGAAASYRDSVTGQTFVFPNGAHGVLDVARVLAGPAVPLPDVTQFRAAFSGPEQVEIAVASPPGGETQAFQFGDDFTAATVGPITDRWWGMARSRESGDSVFYLLKAGTGGSLLAPLRDPVRIIGPGTPPGRPFGAFALGPVAPRISAYAVVGLPAGSSWTPLITGYRATVQQTVDWWLATLPVADASRARAAITAHEPLSITVGIGVGSAYDYGVSSSGWRPLLTFDDRIPAEREKMVRHETGHYLAHMMLGDAAYLTLTNNGPVAVNHAPGEVARGFRGSLGEEYAYASQFFMMGTLDGYDLRSLAPSNNVRDMMLDLSPASVDFPSLEGFGATMLAAVTRTGTDTMVYDFWASGSRTRSPALDINTTSVLGLLAKGPQNPNELRVLLSTLVEGDEALAAVLEPMGWSYWGSGRVVDGTGHPVAGASVSSVVKVGDTEYRTLASALTGNDGAFVLRRIYPGTSLLRVYQQNGARIDSTDAAMFTIPWETATTTPQSLGDLVLTGLPAYNDIAVSVSGFSSTNSAGADPCPSKFYLANELYGGVWNSTTRFPLSWSGNHFTANGSVDFTLPATDGAYSTHGTGSTSVAGTVDRVTGDSVWITLTGSQSTREETLMPGPTWTLDQLISSSFTIGSIGLARNGASPATYTGNVQGAAAAVVIGGATASYFNQSALLPTFHPYSCNGYSFNPLTAEVQVTLRVVNP